MNIFLTNKPPPGSIKKMKKIEGFVHIDCTVGLLSLENIGPVNEIGTCTNLHNYMELCKVNMYYDDNGPVDKWFKKRLWGFEKKDIFNYNNYLYTYTDRKLTWLEERQLLKTLVKKYIDKNTINEIKKNKNIQLFDYYVPNIGSGFLFKEDKLINYKNYKYSHVYAIAELLLE